MIHRAAALGVVLLAMVLPAVSWWQIATARIPFDSVLETPLFVFTAGGLALVGVWLATRDRWLGVFVLYAAASAVAGQTYLGLAVAHWITLGALGVEAIRTLPPAWRSVVIAALMVLGAAQVGYGALQWAEYDPLFAWHRDEAARMTGHAIPFVVHGTIGNPKFYGTLLAVLTPLAPWRLVPVLLVGVILSGSALAALAVALGLLWRTRTWRARGLVAGASLATCAGAVITRGGGLNEPALWLATLRSLPISVDTFWARLDVWALAARHWLATDATWFGRGFGAWYYEVPFLQALYWPMRREIFLQAHNEYLQLVYEGGVVALVLFGAWAWSHRRAVVASPYRGAALALAIESVALFPFRVATVAVTCLVIVGLVTSEPPA